MIDAILVFGGYLDFAEASCLLDDCLVQNGVVESGQV